MERPDFLFSDIELFTTEDLRIQLTTGVAKIVLPRLRECSGQVEAEVVSNSRNKIHQTWESLFGTPMYTVVSPLTHALDGWHS